MIKNKISIIIFFLSVILFCLNLNMNYSDDLKIAFFWLSIGLMLGNIIYQIFYLKYHQIILFEIIIVFFLLHLLYQINYYGLAESDSYRDYDFLKIIINTGHIIYEPINFDISGWPLIHLFTSITSIITKIEPLVIAKYLPSFIESIIAIPIYLLVSTISKNKKAALLSCLLLSSIPQFMSFESLFVRESYALFFFIFFFYIIYIAKQRNDKYLLSLSIFLIPVIVLSHHFTSFMLIIFLFIFIIVSKIIPYLFRKKWIPFLFNTDEHPNFVKINIDFIFITLLIASLAYWLYFTPHIIRNFFQIYYEATGTKEFITYGQRIGIGQTIVTLRGYIEYYGFFFFHLILSLILLIAILLKKQKNIIENISFTSYLYFCLFLGSLSLFVMGSLLFPDRFLSFGWLLGVIPLSILFFNLKNTNVKKILAVVIISFLIFNIYNIDPKYYTGKGPFDGRASEKEYAIAETINVSRPYFGYIGVADAIYDIQRVVFKNGGMINPLESANLFNDSHLAIIYNDLFLNLLEFEKIKSPVIYNRISTILSYENFNDINKICDVGDVYILTWKNN
jgi:hypothetical protein